MVKNTNLNSFKEKLSSQNTKFCLSMKEMCVSIFKKWQCCSGRTERRHMAAKNSALDLKSVCTVNRDYENTSPMLVENSKVSKSHDLLSFTN